MKRKTKLRKFFTLTRNPDAGFTLVELVIVIAILAILSAVAVPAYNGYMAKAREAADQMIIAAVNDAFAAACMENKVDAMDVSEASVSVLDGKVYGLSSATYDSDAGFVDKVAPYFLTYYTDNEEKNFKTPNINSLVWNDALDSFEMNEGFVATRVVLSSGKTITVSAEDMEKITNSTYADMGYSGVKEVIEAVGESGETLAGICSLGTVAVVEGGFMGIGGTPTGEYTGLLPKLTNAMKAYGLIDSTKEGELLKNLCLADDLYGDEYKASGAERDQSIQEAANGLTMITAKYLSSGGDPEALLAMSLGNSSTDLLGSMADSGGTKTVSAIAIQYALASSFANSDASDGVTIDGKTVAQYLAAADDPVEAIDKVKNLDAYKNNYVSSDPTSQYQQDVNGFVGTLSILGENLGTINAPGNIDLEDFLANGINSSDAEDVLTGVLGD